MYNFTDGDIKRLIQLNHPEKFLAFFPGMNEKTAADFYAITVDKYRNIVSEYKENADSAAEELINDEKLVSQVKKLPFIKGETIIGFGDSITDDYQSWFEILTRVMNLIFGKDYFKFVNAGISGDTSLNLIKRFPGVVAQKPDWIICMIGTNDCIRSRLLPTRTNISFIETAKNLDYLVNLAKEKTSAEWIWITPPKVNANTIEKDKFTDILQNCWQNEDLYIIGQEMNRRNEFTVDIWGNFGNPVDDALLSSDGLHPSIKGHKLIVKTLLEALSNKYTRGNR